MRIKHLRFPNAFGSDLLSNLSICVSNKQIIIWTRLFFIWSRLSKLLYWLSFVIIYLCLVDELRWCEFYNSFPIIIVFIIIFFVIDNPMSINLIDWIPYFTWRWKTFVTLLGLQQVILLLYIGIWVKKWPLR